MGKKVLTFWYFLDFRSDPEPHEGFCRSRIRIPIKLMWIHNPHHWLKLKKKNYQVLRIKTILHRIRIKYQNSVFVHGFGSGSCLNLTYYKKKSDFFRFSLKLIQLNTVEPISFLTSSFKATRRGRGS